MNRKACHHNSTAPQSGNCGCGSLNNNCRNEVEGGKLLMRIQEIDFSIYETALYLDVYPDCREALAYYHTLLEARETLICEYERMFGPITMLGNKSTTSWDWINSPWPWQM